MKRSIMIIIVINIYIPQAPAPAAEDAGRAPDDSGLCASVSVNQQITLDGKRGSQGMGVNNKQIVWSRSYGAQASPVGCPMRVSDAGRGMSSRGAGGRGMSSRVAGVRCMSRRVAREPSRSTVELLHLLLQGHVSEYLAQ